MQPSVVFDLDGTLIDSAPDIAAALNRTLAAQGLPALPVHQVAAMVGDGARVLLARAFAAHQVSPDAAGLDRATAAYLADYAANGLVATLPYPNVAQTLAALDKAGWRMAVCTNKPETAARAILGGLGLGPFAVVAGGDTFPVRKPHPGHLARTLGAAGMTSAVMVGDHHNDMAAARGCGLKCVWASWGYAASDPGADAVAPSFAELPGLLARLSEPGG
jgi:phosphoglycolate phosphatase